jgi:hypothetical protein
VPSRAAALQAGRHIAGDAASSGTRRSGKGEISIGGFASLFFHVGALTPDPTVAISCIGRLATRVIGDLIPRGTLSATHNLIELKHVHTHISAFICDFFYKLNKILNNKYIFSKLRKLETFMNQASHYIELFRILI